MTKLYALLILVVLMACGNKGSHLKTEEIQESSAAKEPVNEARFLQVGAAIPTERKLIKNGQVTMKVSSVEETRKEVDKICNELTAYISSEQQSNLGDRLQHTLMIRVTAPNYDPLAARVETLARSVESKNVTVQDVTEEFIDVEARLGTKMQLVSRYREILKEAKTVSDILAIESQIGNVQSEIESMEGRLKYLRDQVSYSTLTLTYYQVIGVDFGFGSKFMGAIANGWDNLLGFIVGTMNLWPFLILIGTGYWFYVKWRNRKTKH
jgi:hypothetical protein